jgi:hypothetical protein
MPISSAAEKRSNYRIHYPLKLRPCLCWDGIATSVVDISEGGIRFINSEGVCAGAPGTILRGTVQLRCGNVAEISGRVVWATARDAGLSLARGISFSTILREQRALRARQRYATQF